VRHPRHVELRGAVVRRFAVRHRCLYVDVDVDVLGHGSIAVPFCGGGWRCSVRVASGPSPGDTTGPGCWRNSNRRAPYHRGCGRVKGKLRLLGNTAARRHSNACCPCLGRRGTIPAGGQTHASGGVDVGAWQRLVGRQFWRRWGFSYYFDSRDSRIDENTTPTKLRTDQ
jgi:hypothetical protein